MPITIQAPRQGIAQSPFVGFSDIRMLDIYSTPGIVQLNNINSKASGTVVTGAIKWMILDPLHNTDVYAIDENGVVYKSTTYGSIGSWAVLPGNTTVGQGQGLAIWKDYLFVARSTVMDVYGPLSGASCSISSASPAVVTKTAHGLVENDTVIFSSVGTLTGIAINTLYYVIAAGFTADTFEVSLTQGGVAVNSAGSAGTGHKYTAWDLAWKSDIDADTLWHPMLESKNDGKLYGGAGKYVYSLEETTTFKPSTASFTWTPQALDLPSSYRIKCLEELGNNLLCGTWQGTSIQDVQIADIFPWDRSSSSYSQPIGINDYGIHAMKNIGGSVIVLGGITGTIYKTDGASIIPIAKLPIDLSGPKYLEWFPGAICKYKNKVFFGVGDAGTTADRIGVYSLLQTGQGNILTLEYLNSSLTDGTTAIDVEVSAICPIQYTILSFAFNSSSTYAIDVTNSTSYAFGTDYSGFFESPMYQVGSRLKPFKFTQIEFQLARPLRTGEGIKLEYRKDLTATYTTIGTYPFSTIGAVTSWNVITEIPNDIKECEQIQIKVSLLGTATTTPQLKQVILQ